MLTGDADEASDDCAEDLESEELLSPQAASDKTAISARTAQMHLVMILFINNLLTEFKIIIILVFKSKKVNNIFYQKRLFIRNVEKTQKNRINAKNLLI